MQSNHVMPAIFIGHGSPENAFEINEFNTTWKKISASFNTPKAILVISAHWTNYMTDKVATTSVAATLKPETIHDFYGFPENYYDFIYNTSGSPDLAEKITKLSRTVKIKKDNLWGLDHGAWSVLSQMYPKADIPTLQLSIDEDLPREKLFAIGKELGQLRKEGVLILSSGNIVHNLSAVNWNGTPYDWATEFDGFVKANLEEKNYQTLINFEQHQSARFSLPTVEHFLPLLYVLGATEGEKPTFFCEKIFASSISMRCITYGIN